MGLLLSALANLSLTASLTDLPPPAYAAQINTEIANPVVLILVLGALALAPFALIMMTSFVKISVVPAILCNALGTQQAPPNQVITGAALVITICIMAPVAEKCISRRETRGQWKLSLTNPLSRPFRQAHSGAGNLSSVKSSSHFCKRFVIFCHNAVSSI